MKRIIFCLSIASLLATNSNAGSVTWQSVQTISGASDVSTLGTYFGSWAPYGSALAVNGVTFQPNDLPGYTRDSFFNNTGSSFGSPGTADANYNTLLGSAVFSDTGTGAGFSGSGLSFTWGGMTPGDTYEVQLWVEDMNNTGVRRWENIFGDEGAHGSAGMNYPSDGTGLGSYVIGTFVASPTGTQTLNLETWSTVGGQNYGQVNLFQVRDLTVVPEPSTLAFLAGGLVLLGFRRSR